MASSWGNDSRKVGTAHLFNLHFGKEIGMACHAHSPEIIRS
ncbi:hypothetical protein SAMN05444166_7413 [Singulisphaera sp. GP187]|nr:hypothetical protein SAMN05444166_7413 [Singulisphaera sp. GP187]